MSPTVPPRQPRPLLRLLAKIGIATGVGIGVLMYFSHKIRKDFDEHAPKPANIVAEQFAPPPASEARPAIPSEFADAPWVKRADVMCLQETGTGYIGVDLGGGKGQLPLVKIVCPKAGEKGEVYTIPKNISLLARTSPETLAQLVRALGEIAVPLDADEGFSMQPQASRAAPRLRGLTPA